ncbi:MULTISPECIES: 2-C-methyl-D-erythritol 4-phosphate cytidylyltransferase [unclassified Thermosynechococcus]|uniref:2-C-methyl-D-erythritol 4-phosphate cytidylyltransferase n=1 Tax=unclassified Thermosynechococcus TaxID=2622553 RepID=UPI0028732E82|nr:MULTISPECIES: 2-C-methyl-D-erythritol 4-phosphate cytidylyltransferase [unclassified Thermosynechococcus]WNC32526.1 2-C-methyl-D-erythritol 4-phosphate cytidylyltransferase [Thermosynechococcus sp. PKX95]WNC35056.1 2-C-methyl-D-erythritol 4-phosphate cytidylyltransferase [Thermosynechococcus sp. PKX91]WNC37572.1 2-C-methyl-D-erythritol 4-phosphate cytidylyltransferase [Thermosynechococcus sp. WL11]WNC40094.1 2-C-methyl-D-erythritol 4-phosphate cytidylyltransferase [Thermosynechococcus sp. WL
MHILIPAAGMGKRMGAGHNKLRLQLLGKPLLAWTLAAVAAAEAIEWIGVIGQPEDFPTWEALLGDLNLRQPVQLIEGGETRQASVFNGLQALPERAEQVLIHDGARCLATPDLINRCAQALETYAGLIAAVPVKDTIKIVNREGVVVQTPERDSLWAAQTPQGFRVEPLRIAHEMAVARGWEVTDDAALFERLGYAVHIVLGEETNLKITTPSDLPLAERILQHRQEQGQRDTMP